MRERKSESKKERKTDKDRKIDTLWRESHCAEREREPVEREKKRERDTMERE